MALLGFQDFGKQVQPITGKCCDSLFIAATLNVLTAVAMGTSQLIFFFKKKKKKKVFSSGPSQLSAACWSVWVGFCQIYPSVLGGNGSVLCLAFRKVFLLLNGRELRRLEQSGALGAAIYVRVRLVRSVSVRLWSVGRQRLSVSGC